MTPYQQGRRDELERMVGVLNQFTFECAEQSGSSGIGRAVAAIVDELLGRLIRLDDGHPLKGRVTSDLDSTVCPAHDVHPHLTVANDRRLCLNCPQCARSESGS